MYEFLDSKCPKCGKALKGVLLEYNKKWLCSECVEDKSDTLHCERGSKVIAVCLDNGYTCDSEQAHKFLVEGKIYEVDRIDIGRSNSKIWLKEFPNQAFNTVHFKRIE